MQLSALITKLELPRTIGCTYIGCRRWNVGTLVTKVELVCMYLCMMYQYVCVTRRYRYYCTLCTYMHFACRGEMTIQIIALFYIQFLAQDNIVRCEVLGLGQDYFLLCLHLHSFGCAHK
jgi:hypothetical protein